ncbi:hypothetical protein PUN28_003446 [Cardiocondyla obscurior]|uniref:Uncharacterized protein n=1 Tax=Cardiocondyla obscurior TaxID=286306 RepID=A0AAW2GLU0_9HYME
MLARSYRLCARLRPAGDASPTFPFAPRRPSPAVDRAAPPAASPPRRKLFRGPSCPARLRSLSPPDVSPRRPYSAVLPVNAAGPSNSRCYIHAAHLRSRSRPTLPHFLFLRSLRLPRSPFRSLFVSTLSRRERAT